MSNDLSVLEKHRDALLLAEIAAWLHMLGKLQEKFLESNHTDKDTRDLDLKIPDDVPTDLRLLLESTWPGDVWSRLPIPKSDLRASGLKISNLMERHRREPKPGTEGFIKLLIDAHGRGSGIEKGALNGFLNSHNNPVYLSTSLGCETSIKDMEIKQAQQILYKLLQERLDELEKKKSRLNFLEWSELRIMFVTTIQQCFQITVAETRRPLNDVTLFDQTAMSVAFFKSALAQNLLKGGWKEPVQTDVEEKYHWRLLRVGLDGLAFWSNALRVGDLLARKELIENALDQVQDLLEMKYPLGSEVYRDENGSIFIVPDISDIQIYVGNAQSLEELIQAIIVNTLSGETQFTISLSERTRDTLRFGRLLEEALPKPSPQSSWLRGKWQGQASDVCPACGLRPQALVGKASGRKVCDVCEKRRADRSKIWIGQLNPTDQPDPTIWIDEVADQHGQIALVVARFDISDWLNSNVFNSIPSFDPESRTIDSISMGFDLQVLTNDIQRGLQPGQVFEDNLLGQLIPDPKTRGSLNLVSDFYDLRIKGTDLETIPYLREPALLTLSLMRQQPSFARIRRTWETTRAFWQEIETDFKGLVGEIGTRIKISGRFIPNGNTKSLGITHAYELRLGVLRLSIICTQENEFLSAENLQYIATLLDVSKKSHSDYSSAALHIQNLLLQAGSVSLEESAGYNSSNTPLGKLQITNVAIERTPYFPAIPLLAEPSVFMALVPADKALKVVQHIKEKYKTEMGKVRNRLPMAIGIVFADRRTPFPAILDTGRRMLKQPLQDECWMIEEIQQTYSATDSKLILKVEFALNRNGRFLKMEIPTVMGDKITKDAWYPYWWVEKDKDGNKPAGRKRQFTSINGEKWVHVCDLVPGDTIHLHPSRFDFELLDTAARRFEVSYAGGKRRGGMRPARPYYIEQLDSFEQLWELLSKHLATSQIDNLIGLIETKRQEWLTQQNDDVFRQAIEDMLHNANWQGEPLSLSEFEQLARAAVSGQLADVVELAVTILKKKTTDDLIGGIK